MKNLDDGFLPMHEEDIVPLAEAKRKRDNYWRMLYAARSDFMKLMNDAKAEYDTDAGNFGYYLKENYGLQMEMIDGNITSNFNILDEKKYLLFLLKYGAE